MSKLKIDIDDLRAIAELVAETGLTEIEIESEGISLRVAKEVPQVVTQAQVQMPAAMPAAALAAAPAAAMAPATAAAAPADDDPFANATPVVSPMVGTVYTSPEPGAAPFVKVGDVVSEGQTVMIVEAMKTMNPVPASKSGKVVAVMVENEQPVEFDQQLVLIS